MEVFKLVVMLIVNVGIFGGLLLWGGLHLLGIWNTAQDIALGVVICTLGVVVGVAALEGTGIWNLAVAYYSKDALEKRKRGRLSSERKWERLFDKGEITPQKWRQWMEENEGGGTTQDEIRVKYEIRKRKQEAKQLKREAKQ